MQHDLEIRVKLIDLCEEVLHHCAEMNYALILKDLSLLIRLAATFNPLNVRTVCETHQHAQKSDAQKFTIWRVGETEKERLPQMTNVSSFEGLATVVLVFICSCAHVRRVKALRPLTTLTLTGPLSLFHKASVIGLRLKEAVGCICIFLGFYILFLKR